MEEEEEEEEVRGALVWRETRRRTRAPWGRLRSSATTSSCDLPVISTPLTSSSRSPDFNLRDKFKVSGRGPERERKRERKRERECVWLVADTPTFRPRWQRLGARCS